MYACMYNVGCVCICVYSDSIFLHIKLVIYSQCRIKRHVIAFFNILIVFWIFNPLSTHLISSIFNILHRCYIFHQRLKFIIHGFRTIHIFIQNFMCHTFNKAFYKMVLNIYQFVLPYAKRLF